MPVQKTIKTRKILLIYLAAFVMPFLILIQETEAQEKKKIEALWKTVLTRSDFIMIPGIFKKIM